MPDESLSEFQHLIQNPDGAIDLARGALILARDEYPALDVSSYVGRLERLAEGVRPRLAASGSNPFAAIDALNTFLFHDQGFRGNAEAYSDPRNSYLNEVLDRRCGIPITLSLVYMEVARRAGFDIEGVGFPGHFIVRHRTDDREILIDPFHGGEILLPDDCRRRLKETFGDNLPLEPRFLQRASTRGILARMLNNLKHIYMQEEDYGRALRIIDRLIQLTPSDPHHIRDRGVARFKLVRLAGAAADLEAYIRLSPEAPDASDVRKQLRTIRRLTAMLN